MQVDTIARYLNKLKDAKVPVLWRPYHEMNGDWFWWGVSFLPYKMEIIQKENDLTIQSTFIVEYADDRVIEQKLTLDGKE